MHGSHFTIALMDIKLMSIGIDPSGSGAGKGTHVSVLVDILKGDHDDNLDWLFVSIELLNQLEDDNH